MIRCFSSLVDITPPTSFLQRSVYKTVKWKSFFGQIFWIFTFYHIHYGISLFWTAKVRFLRETQPYLLCPWGFSFQFNCLFWKMPNAKIYISTKYLLSFFSFLPQIATYTSSSTLSWRIVETGDLPSGRRGLKAAVVENVLYVTGGSDDHWNDLTAILSWDPLQEKWTYTGDLKVARKYHATIPSNAIECAAMP